MDRSHRKIREFGKHYRTKNLVNFLKRVKDNKTRKSCQNRLVLNMLATNVGGKSCLGKKAVFLRFTLSKYFIHTVYKNNNR